MCNLYNVTTNQEAIRAVSKAFDRLGNLKSSLDIYPNQMAPIVRNNGGERELTRVRWGMPSSQQAIYQAATKRADKLRAKGKDVDFQELLKMEPDGGTTNIRNTSSKHWLRWTGVENRCVVPFTRFAEPDPARSSAAASQNAWFARDESEPLMFFAGLWVRDWQSVPKVKEGVVTCDLFAFLTTEPNAIVEPIHPKAMPMILRDPYEVDAWLTAPVERRRYSVRCQRMI
ncbi:MAG TPA: SOS response-associated peptidase family protein [Pseudorhizobium sp.]|jgi:putative SOS response-associated peptidase YedK|nr:SOS response-associated peptidase family protein [Pseudorhizobium sp.]